MPIKISDKRFWVSAKGPLDDLRIPQLIAGNLPETHIVSGPCLFSKESVKGIAEDGTEFFFTDPPASITKKLQKILINAKLSLYEIESSLRLSSFINALIKLSRIKIIYFNIPDIEYYFYILDAYNDGYITANLALKWFDSVDKRNIKILRLMKKTTLEGLLPHEESKIVKLSPLSVVSKYLKKQISANRKVSFKHALSILQRSSALWDELIQIKNPTTWIQLNNISYIYAELYPSFRHRKSRDTQLTLAVENPMEDNIFINLRKILDQVRLIKNTDIIIGIYPHETVISSDGKLLYDTQFLHTDDLSKYRSQKKFIEEVQLLLEKSTTGKIIPLG